MHLKQILKSLHLDHCARFMKYYSKTYAIEHPRYDETLYYKDFLNSQEIDDTLRNYLRENPAPYVYIETSSLQKKCIGLKYWLDNVLRLKKLRTYIDYRPLASLEGYLYYIEKGKLFRKNDIIDTCEYLSNFTLHDRQYSEMDGLNSCYVIRSGDVIKVSQNLKDWTTIYKGKRGVKNSLLLTEKGGDIVLIFIEYSTGRNIDDHRVLQYNYSTKELTVLKTFFNTNSKRAKAPEDCIRHIHVIQEDPYTGYLYIGTGDSDGESGIFISKDKGTTWGKMCSGNQRCRTLSFIFTEKKIIWNTDTHEKQFLIAIDKKTNYRTEYPLLNSALWCTMSTEFKGRLIYIMSSNSEGALYDNNNRVYGIEIIDEKPVVYNLLSSKSRTVYTQHFPICIHNNNIYFYYSHYDIVEEYSIEEC